MAKAKVNKNYEELGRAVAAFYENGYLNKKKALKMSFLKGLMSGLGGVIGATIIVAILVWILSLVVDAPLIGDYAKDIKDTIKVNQ
jgi:uncharacterized membrane protein YfcA